MFLESLLRLVYNVLLPMLITINSAFGNINEQELINQIKNAKTVNEIKKIFNQFHNINQHLNHHSVLKYIAENNHLQNNYSSGLNIKRAIYQVIGIPPKDPYATLVEYFISRGGQIDQIQNDLIFEVLSHHRIAMAEVLIANNLKYNQNTIIEAIKIGVSELTIIKMINNVGLPPMETLYNESLPGIAAQRGYGKLVKKWIEEGLIDKDMIFPPRDGYSNMKIIDYALKAIKIENNLSLIEFLIQNHEDLKGKYRYQDPHRMSATDSESLLERIFKIDDGKIGIQIVDAAVKYQNFNLLSLSSKGGYSAYHLIKNPSWVPELIKRGLKIDLYEFLAVLNKMSYRSPEDGKWYKSANYDSWLGVIKLAFDQNKELLFNPQKRSQILELANYLKCVEVINHIYQISRPQLNTEVIKSFQELSKEEKNTSSKFGRLSSLIQFSSNEDFKETIDGKTGLHLLAQISTSLMYDDSTSRANFEKLATQLLEKGINLNATDNQGKTALDYAIIYKNNSLINFFLSQNADVSFQSLDLALDTLERYNQNEINELFNQVRVNDPNFEVIYFLLGKANRLERPDLILGLLKKFPALIQYRKSGFPPLAFFIANMDRPKLNFVEPLLRYILTQDSAETIYRNHNSQTVRLSAQIRGRLLAAISPSLLNTIKDKESQALNKLQSHSQETIQSRHPVQRYGPIKCHWLFN